ncbi:MAG: substrate-binding domain-containing protein, partial [Verrucomicrobiota bacterium]
MPAGHPIDLRPRLREFILSAQKRGETNLPSALELARRWEMVPRTVNRAVSHLLTEGLLMRRGKKLYVVQSPVHRARTEESPFVIHTIVGETSEWLSKLYASRNCTPVFHLFTDVTQCWGLLQKALKSPCEGLILAIGPDMIPPPNAVRFFGELIERRIPVVCNQPIQQGNLVVSEMFNPPAVMRQLAESGHRRVLVPYSNDDLLRQIPKLSGTSWVSSVFDDFGLDAIWEPLGYNPSRKRLREMLARHVSGKSAVTALFSFEQETAVRCYEAARGLGIKIPADLSVVLAMETSSRTPGGQPVSTWWLHNRTGPRLAIDLLVSQIRHVRATGQMPGPEIVRAEPVFIDRGTMRSLQKARPSRSQINMSEAWQARWPLDQIERRKRVQSINTSPYPAASKARENEWVPLDLGGVFNRHFGREHGWFGDLPLLHLPHGREKIHGVPFQIAASSFSTKANCLIMRSSHAHVGKGEELPVEITLEIGKKARAVYFLHGCGWTSKPKSFASYEFHYANGTVHRVLLDPIKGAPNPQSAKPVRLRGNIQDWWPTPFIPQFQSAHARHYVVTNNGEPLLYERYLYTLEWINPHPGKKIKRLVIRSDPEAE